MPRTSAETLLGRLDPAPESEMRALIEGALRTQAIYVVARLGVPDQLALEPRTAGDLAARLGVHGPTLLRVLRYLASCGVFVEDGDGRFGLAPPGQLLQTAHPRSLRPSAIRAGEGMWSVSSRLLNAVQTGVTPHDEVHGTTFFERVGDRASSDAFGARMNGSTLGLGKAIASLESVRRARTIVDVGGGHGGMLIELLREHPSARGVLFDRPATIEGARALIDGAALAERCEAVAGDFFQAVPAGADVYLLSWVLHDWDDERAARILRVCRDAAKPDSTLLVVEVLLPSRATMLKRDDRVITEPYAIDLQMLLLTGGRERTAAEYAELLAGAGYVIRATVKPDSARGASLIEASIQIG